MRHEPVAAAAWMEWAFLVALAAAAAVAYHFSPIPVDIVVDGVERTVTTRAATVGDLLIEAGVPVAPGDLVTPGPGSHLGRRSNVVVRHARPVRVFVDGRVVRLRSLGRTAEDILAQAQVRLADGDRLFVNGSPWPLPVGRPTAGPAPRLASLAPQAAPSEAQAGGGVLPATGDLDVGVFRPVPVELVEDGVAIRVFLAGPTVADAIRGAGIPLDDADGLFPRGDSPLQAGMRIVIRRAIPFFIEADGPRREVRALAETVGQAISALGISLAGRDYSLPPTSESLTPNMTVRVVRVLEDVLVRQVPIPYRTETIADPELPLDETRIDRPGVPGQKTQRIRIVYENGEEIFREVVEETVDREPVTEILAYGTTIVWRTVDTPEGPQRYWRKMRVYATSYSASRSGTPASAPWYGRTRLGWTMRKGIVAVDPRYIPMQSRLFVEGYGVGVAGDTGGGIKRYHIDLGYDDDNYQSWYWPVDLYLLEPLPPERDMIWYLP